MNLPLALGTSGLAAAASLAINSWLGRAARRRNWCDPCGGDLKPHARPTPFTGGIGVLAAFLAGLAFLQSPIPNLQSLIPNLQPPIYNPQSPIPPNHALRWALVAAGGLAVGAWDDLRWKQQTRPFRKLGLQIAAAALAAIALTLPLSGPDSLLPLSAFPLALVFALGAMNAYNLADGLDGLAGGEAAISATGLGLLFLCSGARGPAAAALVLSGALVGFLLLNWHPARVFLGDGGSHLAGAVLAGLSVVAAGLKPGLPGLAAGLLLLGLPVADAGWVICRRLAARRPVFGGDRLHFYDLVRRRLSVRQTVLLMWAVHAALVALGVVVLGR